jgi:2-polyprenyl-6-methoxyphenol hydroxylase-like FAD-dependent oxidoreductase
LGALLGARGIPVTIVAGPELGSPEDSEANPVRISRSSVEILSALELDSAFQRHGHAVRDSAVPAPDPAVLEIDRHAMIRLLETKAASMPQVTVERESELTSLSQHDSGVSLSLRSVGGRGGSGRLTAGWVILCDGFGAQSREWLHMRTVQGRGWRQCEQLFDGRVILCGDGARCLASAEGDEINLGWADAMALLTPLEGILRDGHDPGPSLRAYDRGRRKASTSSLRLHRLPRSAS